MVKNLFSEEKSNHILDIPCQRLLCKDKLLWLDNNSRGFSVSSCYNLNTNQSGDNFSVLWGKIWKLKLHARLQLSFMESVRRSNPY